MLIKPYAKKKKKSHALKLHAKKSKIFHALIFDNTWKISILGTFLPLIAWKPQNKIHLGQFLKFLLHSLHVCFLKKKKRHLFQLKFILTSCKISTCGSGGKLHKNGQTDVRYFIGILPCSRSPRPSISLKFMILGQFSL